MPQKSSKQPKRDKNKFANRIIAICIVVTALVTASIIYEYHRLEIPVTADILTVMFGFWGGDLLIIALRQIFGSDVTKKNETDETTSGGSI